MIIVMARIRTPPRWEREAPLTPEAAAKMYRTVRAYYVVGVAVFWAVCAATAVLGHRAVIVGVLALFAVLDAAAMWWAPRGARAGIRKNTVAQPLDAPDIGL
jgi:hypothetical protein